MSLSDFCDHNFQHDTPKVEKVVTIANSLDKSLQGTYFVGQTPILNLNNNMAYGALFNPKNSKVNLFVNVFTITNFSDIPLIAEIWINSKPPSSWCESSQVTTTNTALCPEPLSKVELIYRENSSPITTGVNAFDRLVPGKSTIVAEEDGKYIVPPGKFFIISLTPTAPGPIKAAIAYGWWIKLIKDC
ncbi:MAG: DUF6143 family protein [Clostridiaceae bacterium]